VSGLLPKPVERHYSPYPIKVFAMKISPRLLNTLLGPFAPVCVGFLLIAGLTTGCDDGATNKSAAAMEARIMGNIRDQHGPIMNSRLEVTDRTGNVLSSTELSGNNSFSIRVPAGTAFPIVLTAHPLGESAANSTPVKAVVTSPLADRMDISDVSTIVVESAISLGGLTAENIAKASGAAIGLRQREGVSAGAGGGGSGAGQSGGGVSRGGHGTHDMGGAGGGAPGAEQPHDMSSGGH
jgi:hypothetical protein